MMRPSLSVAAAGLMRALINRVGVDRHRILLTNFRSVDWNSLTMTGERHELEFRLVGDGAAGLAARLIDGLDEHEFTIPRQIVADISGRIVEPADADGGITVRIEALTVEE